MVRRHHWTKTIEELWEAKSVVWLAGVRRAGKTFLCRSLPDIEYLDCELPSTRRALEDPEAFLRDIGHRRVVLDEVHRLTNPSELLKIAADYYPKTKVIATGSSSLGASRRFRDTLTDRKRDLWLTPMLVQDEEEFGARGLDHRFCFGGLPPFYLADAVLEDGFQDWNRFLLGQGRPGIVPSRAALVLHAVRRADVRPEWRHVRSDTVCRCLRGQPHDHRELSPDPGRYPGRSGHTAIQHAARYRDRRGAEGLWVRHRFRLPVQGVGEIAQRGPRRPLGALRAERVPRPPAEARRALLAGQARPRVGLRHRSPGEGPVAIECKWRADGFEPSNFRAFRRVYPAGENFIVTSDTDRSYLRRDGDLQYRFVGLPDLVRRLV